MSSASFPLLLLVNRYQTKSVMILTFLLPGHFMKAPHYFILLRWPLIIPSELKFAIGTLDPPR